MNISNSVNYSLSAKEIPLFSLGKVEFSALSESMMVDYSKYIPDWIPSGYYPGLFNRKLCVTRMFRIPDCVFRVVHPQKMTLKINDLVCLDIAQDIKNESFQKIDTGDICEFETLFAICQYRKSPAVDKLIKEKGAQIADVNGKRFYVGRRIEELKSYKKAMNYSFDFFSLKNEEDVILWHIINIHRLLSGLETINRNSSDLENPFRTKISVVTRLNHDYSNLKACLGLFKNSLAQQTERDLTGTVCLTPNTANPKFIKHLMVFFIEELKFRYTEKEGECHELAAWAHQKIADIHPFDDANGRLARVIMNTILKNGNACPVFFPDEDAYTDAVTSPEPDRFSNYLLSLIKRMSAEIVRFPHSVFFPDKNV